ncbi:11875_t:CDS:2, partial [Scutellospora calospora]
ESVHLNSIRTAQELQEPLQNNNINLEAQELQELLQNNSIESSISATSIKSSTLTNHYQQINIKKQQASKDHFFKQSNKYSYFLSADNEDKSSEDEYLNPVISKELLHSLLNMPNTNYINSHSSSKSKNSFFFQDETQLLQCKLINLKKKKKPLKQYIDIFDYNSFQDNQVEVNVLKTFVAKSLQIHVEYLIAESNGKSPNYTSIVLNCIKELDNITINFTFLAATYKVLYNDYYWQIIAYLKI